MLFHKILKNLFKPFNLILWAAALGVVMFSSSINSLWIILAAFIISIIYTISKFRNEDLSKLLETDNRVYSIKHQNSQCEKLAESAKNSTNSEKRYRVRQVLKSKDDIVNCLLKDQDSSLKQKIASQALELVTVYISLIENYYSRVRDVDDLKLNEVQNRIDSNNLKINSTDNIELQMSLKNSMELDQRLLERLRQEKSEVENLNGKLGYIESSINLLKQQILSNAEEPLLENVEEMINEAIALDTVLTDRRKERNRV